jgi:hypothetical protein
MTNPTGTSSSGSASCPPGKTSRDDERGTSGTMKKNRKNRKPSLLSDPLGFVGKCSDIMDHVFELSPGKNGFDIVATTTRKIGKYIARTVKDGGAFQTARSWLCSAQTS